MKDLIIIRDHSNDLGTNNKCQSLGPQLIISLNGLHVKDPMIVRDHSNDLGLIINADH